MASHPTLSQARTHIEGFLEYTFTDIDWLEEALWAYPIILADGRNLIDGNKSLAVVGDAALQLVVANECYGQRMTREAANDCLKQLTSNPFLGQLDRAHEIEPFVVPNPGTIKLSVYMRATAVEAIIGAVFKDSGGDYVMLKRAIVGFGVLQ